MVKNVDTGTSPSPGLFLPQIKIVLPYRAGPNVRIGHTAAAAPL